MRRLKENKAQFLLALLFVFATLLSSLAAQQGGTTRYTYDEKGRLKTITLPNGEVATYSYDAAGNIVSITRRTQTTITDFSPTEGTVGTEVTINGFGFLATPSANDVRFNSVTAAVLSATVNQLVVEVPLGATTGPLTVSNATNGLATGAQDFVVSQDNPPSITSFSPGIGVIGTSVTIVGTAFSTTPENNIVKFNGVTATINSVTATTIVTSVPAGATTGQISIATPNGTTSSGRNFIVTDAEFIAQMNIGETKTVTITTPNRTALLFFDGTAGQNISLAMTDLNLNPAFRVVVSLLDPPGNTIGRMGAVGEIFTTFTDRLTLPVTGTYTVFVDPRGGVGSLKVTVNSIVDVTGTIQVDGPPVTLNFTTVGQRGRLTFNGSSGQRILVRRISITGLQSIFFTITDPNGQDLSVVDSGDTIYRFVPLPATGTYTLGVFPNASPPVMGSVTMSLTTQPADVTGTITIGGPAVQFTTTTPGQDIRVTFDGAAGQHLNLQLFPVTIPNSLVKPLNPDGTILGFGLYVTTAGTLLDLPDLPATATYTISVVPTNENIGSMTMKVFAPTATPITPGGPPVQVSLPTPSQHPRLSFDGVAGQRVSVLMSNVTIGRYFVQIVKPDGSQLSSTFLISPLTFFVDAQTLPVAGSYTIVIQPQDFSSTGVATVTLYDVPPDASATIATNGTPVPLTTTVPGQNIGLTFVGSVGQQLTLHFSGNTIAGCPTITATNPGGSLLYSSFICNASLDSQLLTLTETGSHTIQINPSLNNIGSITVSITSP